MNTGPVQTTDLPEGWSASVAYFEDHEYGPGHGYAITTYNPEGQVTGRIHGYMPKDDPDLEGWSWNGQEWVRDDGEDVR